MFLDIGTGILISVFISKIFDFPLTWIFISAGIIFSLLMDVDFLFHLGAGKGTKKAHEHRYLLHYPLIYIPAGMFALYFYNPAVSLLFGLCSFIHFLHDSIGIGWGVQWLYPFNTNHFAFLYLYQPRDKEKIPGKLMYIWKHKEINNLDEKYGDENWIRNIYYKWHPYAIVEFIVFIMSLAVLYFNLK